MFAEKWPPRRTALLLMVASACGAALQPPTPAPEPPLASAPAACPEPTCPVPEPPLACDKLAPGTDSTLTSLGTDRLLLEGAAFTDLASWNRDSHADALASYLRSCAVISAMAPEQSMGSGPYAGIAADWQPSCDAARALPAGDHTAARAFFEDAFHLYRAKGREGYQGKFTGYYVQPLKASRKREGRYQFPIYARPSDLLSTQLSSFISDGRSRRIWGKLADDGKSLEPYLTRTELLERGDLEVLLWIDNPGDAVAIEIEGSGQAELPSGETLMVAFAGKNGRPSGRLGSIARAMRKLANGHRKGPWRPKEIRGYWKVIRQKHSVVFFEIEERTGAIGTQDVILSPGRSLAVDRGAIALSTPVWLETRAPAGPGQKSTDFRRLLIAQDTGGAIRGSIRGDIYFGVGSDAVDVGRRTRASGSMWLLLPKNSTFR